MSPLLSRAVAAMALAAALALVAGPAPVSAHERRSAGPLQLVAGWGDEPAYTGVRNSVQVTITEANGTPVTDVVDTLKVEVVKGSDTTTVPLVANFRAGGPGTPGDYRAWLTPTRPGAYTFRVTGTIRGQNVNESFSSSPTTFNDVEDATAIQFPAKDPTTGQLATRVEREVPRLDAALRAAEDRADSAQRLAYAGLGVGALGLLAAVCALAAGRRRDDRRRRGGGRGDEDPTPTERRESLSR